MGKTKHKPYFNTTHPSEVKAYSSRMDSLSKEKSTHSIDRHAHKSLASIIDIMDNSAKRPSSYHSHQNHNRFFFSTKPRNYYGCQYSWRKSSNNDSASSSHVRSGEKVWLKKQSTQSNINSSHHKENKEKAFCRHGRTMRSSFVADDASSKAAVKLVCGLCDRSLKRKPFVYENTISSGELSVVAILVCGHVYHADCLELKTRHEDIHDPLCPLCASRNDCTN